MQRVAMLHTGATTQSGVQHPGKPDEVAMNPIVSRLVWFPVVAALALGVAGVEPVAAQVPPGGLPATVVGFSPQVENVTYPSIDYGKKPTAQDDRHATTTWRMVHGTGNCCENYLTVTSAGRLLDFGGTYVNYTDDRGLTWRQVQPLTPLVNGEGGIVAGINGDVLGVGWDPYSGDHLQAYKLDGATGQWKYTEMPLHQPFYDREWISVVPGPITINGQTYPYVSFIKGATPWKELWFYSTDGLTYTDITSKAVDEMLSGAATQGALPTAARASSDWTQANTNGGMTNLGGGRLLADGDLQTTWSLFDGSAFAWSAYTEPDGTDPEGRFQVDSAGRIHNVVPSADGSAFDYRISADGGVTWQSVTVPLPRSHTIEEWDFRANKAAGVAAVAIHAQNLTRGTDQDLAYKLSIATGTPVLKQAYVVGLGDQNSTAGVTNDVRMDFQTLAIFPDGRIAMSVLDSTTNEEPALVIEQGTNVGSKVGGSTGGTVTPVLGAPYAAWTFDASDEGWASAGTGLWTRQSPGTKTGSDDAATAGWSVWDVSYVDMANATLTSPPVTTQAGASVVQFWLKLDTEPSFDYVYLEWSSNGTSWQPVGSFSGRGAAYPDWEKVLLGFDSPGGPIQLRFRFAADQLCSFVEPVFCNDTYHGAMVDEVILARQGP
jgi:hypothetical protein